MYEAREIRRERERGLVCLCASLLRMASIINLLETLERFKERVSSIGARAGWGSTGDGGAGFGFIFEREEGEGREREKRERERGKIERKKRTIFKRQGLCRPPKSPPTNIFPPFPVSITIHVPRQAHRSPLFSPLPRPFLFISNFSLLHSLHLAIIVHIFPLYPPHSLVRCSSRSTTIALATLACLLGGGGLLLSIGGHCVDYGEQRKNWKEGKKNRREKVREEEEEKKGG